MPTSRMTTREIAKYLAEQQQRGWQGSMSIHPLGRRRQFVRPVTRDDDGAYRVYDRLDGLPPSAFLSPLRLAA